MTPSRPALLLALLLWLAAAPMAGCGAVEDLQRIGGGEATPAAAGAGSGEVSEAGMSPAEEALALEVLARTNAVREQAGLPALLWHEGAAAAAKAHCDDMDARDYFAHLSPEGVGPGGRLTAAGVLWRVVAENIARGHPDPAAVTAAWMASDGHRGNLLSPDVTHLGVGVRLAPGGPWWAQTFLTPR